MANEGWTLVTRRRRPSHFLPSPQPPPRHTTPLNLKPPTYAQVLRSGPNPPHMNNNPRTSQDKATGYIRSPSSPTNLRYPPNPHFKEWWGRCFRCAKKGHIVAECKLPRTTSTGGNSIHLAEHHDPQWAGSSSSMALPSPPQQPTKTTRDRVEPTFEEFLAQPEPLEEPYMPTVRPDKVMCYINRDEQYLEISRKLSSAIVIQPPASQKKEFSLDQAATIVAASNKLSTDQMQVGRISNDRFLVVLPPEMNKAEVVAALPGKVWEEGYILQPYSPLLDATISIPFFKIWVDIKGVPLELYTEAHIAKIISSFGVYLGSMEPQTVGDCQIWSVFLATDDLAQIPYRIDIRVGGMVHQAQICPRKWIKGQVFKRSDLPPTPIPYRSPKELTTTPRQKETPPGLRFDPEWFQHEDVMPFSLTALREIFRHIPPDELPPEFVACLAGDRNAIKANHEAYRNRGGDEERRGRAERIYNTQPTPVSAAPDPRRLAIIPDTLQQPTPTPDDPTPCPHAPLTATAIPATATTEATVRRTDYNTGRGKRTQEDFALQVCDPDLNQNLGYSQEGWEPRDLFPEIHTPPPQTDNQTGTVGKRQCVKDQIPKKVVIPRRTGRNRINKKKNEKEGAIELDVQDFVDVPLQHAEGRELLALIGATSFPIPSHILSSQQQLEVGQPSKAPNKKNRQSTLVQDPSELHEVQVRYQGEDTGGLRPNQSDSLQGPLSPENGQAENELADEEMMQQDDLPDPASFDREDPYLDQVDYSDEDPPQ